jgi:site-specific DNA-methyltransferase (adenine-specific)
VNPYYEDDHVTIYHGDCLDLVDDLSFDVVVTDPPYGMGYKSGWARDLIWNDVYGDAGDGSIESDGGTETRDAFFASVSLDTPAVVFGRYGIEPPFNPSAVLVWDKGMSAGMGDLRTRWRPNWELIFTRGDGFTGGRDSGVISAFPNIPRVSMGRRHPHAKPTELLSYLIDKSPPGVILDPFMGAGPTLRAAKNLGRHVIGIELVEKYCEVAAKRMGQEVLPW